MSSPAYSCSLFNAKWFVTSDQEQSNVPSDLGVKQDMVCFC